MKARVEEAGDEGPARGGADEGPVGGGSDEGPAVEGSRRRLLGGGWQEKAPGEKANSRKLLERRFRTKARSLFCMGVLRRRLHNGGSAEKVRR
jgi:hypothetical protein